jgi:hypothetical protein
MLVRLFGVPMGADGILRPGHQHFAQQRKCRRASFHAGLLYVIGENVARHLGRRLRGPDRAIGGLSQTDHALKIQESDGGEAENEGAQGTEEHSAPEVLPGRSLWE